MAGDQANVSETRCSGERGGDGGEGGGRGSGSGSDRVGCVPSVIRTFAETIKQQLSTEDVVTAECIAHVVATDTCVPVSLRVTRDDFHDTCSELFSRVMSPVSLLLEEANMDPNDIDEVGSRMFSVCLCWVRACVPCRVYLCRWIWVYSPDLTSSLRPQVVMVGGSSRIPRVRCVVGCSCKSDMSKTAIQHAKNSCA